MSTTNDTRPEMEGPSFKWETYARQLEDEHNTLRAQLATERAALELCRASRVALMDLVERERAKVAELVAALEAVSSAYDALLDADHGWERTLSEQCEQVLARAKEVQK